MENNIQIFKNEIFGELRTVVIDNEPWFVGKDVAENLGYSNPRKAIIDHVDEDDKRGGVTIRDSIGREQNPVFINESGLYALVFTSKLPKAREFKHWVTAVVLPSIRKTGGYVSNEDMFINTYLPFADETIKGLFRTQLHIVRKQNEVIAAQKQQIQEYEPKVNYYDQILSCQNAIPISIIAKDYGLSAQALNKKLNEMKIEYKMGETWLLYAQYQNCGYTKTCTISDGCGKSHTHTNWTQKGRIFLYEKLKAVGILPLCEQS